MLFLRACARTGIWRVPGLHVPRPVSLLRHGNGRGARQIRERQAPGMHRDGGSTNGSLNGALSVVSTRGWESGPAGKLAHSLTH